MPFSPTRTGSGNDWVVRPYRPGDAEHLSRIYAAAVRSLAARYYAPDQIAAWLSIAPDENAIAAIYGGDRTALVCTAGHLPVAFSDHDMTGHIRFLYCDPTCAGRGAADQLMSAIEASALRMGIASLSSEASEAALGFFTRHGFRSLARRDFEISGVPIHNHAVVKHLSGATDHAS